MNEHGRIARALVKARSEDAVLKSYPGAYPQDLHTAYSIQDVAIGLTGRRIAGWKLGRVAAHQAERYGADRLAGPIFEDAIVEVEGHEIVAVPVLRGFAAVEAEVLVKTARTVPPGVSPDEVPDFLADVRIGLEIASSPFPGINDNGPAVTASDFGNNFGLVVGPSINDWRNRDLLSAPTMLQIDGLVMGEGRAAEMLDGPFGSVAFLARLLDDRGMTLEAGCWVSTGALTGVHPIAVGQEAEATFDRQFRVRCRIRSCESNNRDVSALRG